MPELRGVLGRVRRDRQVSNLLYGLLGYEDESDPQEAIRSLAVSARATLEGSGPDYLERVAGAAHLLIEMVLDVARSDRDRAVRAAVERAADVVLGPELERRTEMTGIRALPAGDGPARIARPEDTREWFRGGEVEASTGEDGLRLPGDPPTPFDEDIADVIEKNADDPGDEWPVP